MAARVATETETETSGPEQEEAAWAEARETREKVSHLMGQYLLKGFRMLSTNCTDCGNILLRSRDGEYYCVYCQEVAKATTTSSGPSTAVSSSPEHCHHPPATSTPPSGPSTTPPPTPPANTKSGTTDDDESKHTVPVVSSGRTSDTFKMTTTPAADHDGMRFSSDTKRTGPRTNPGVIQSMTKMASPSRSTGKSSCERAMQLKKDASSDTIDLPAQPSVIASLQEAGLEAQSVLVAKLKWCSRELDASHSLEESILLCRLVSSIGEALKALKEGPLSSLAPPSTDTTGL